MYEQRPHDFSSLYFREEENKMLRSGTKKCNICNKKYEEDQIESLWPCGHGYCIECLKYYMIYHLKKQLIIKCPELDCEQVVSKSTLLHQSYSNKKCLKSLLQKEKDKGKQCFICCKIEELQNLCPCQHKFCRLCLSQYLQYKIENQFTLIKCPKSECKQLMSTQSQVYQGLSESLKNRYSKIIQNIKIITSKSFKICPNCPDTRLSEIKNETNLLCTSCFKKYCRICLNLAHRKFAKCDNAVVSILKYKLNFMRCSQCNFVVQKNQGCNHITCPCGYQFCYLCGKYWEGFMHQCPPKPIFIKPKPVEKKIIPPRQILAIPKKNVEFNLPFSPLIVKNKDIFPKKTTNLSFLFLNNRQKRTSSKSSRTPSTKNSSFYSVRAFEGLI